LNGVLNFSHHATGHLHFTTNRTVEINRRRRTDNELTPGKFGTPAATHRAEAQAPQTQTPHARHTFLGGHPAPEDLFRWASAGVRSFATNPNVAGCNNGAGAPAAFFSINGGVANLNQFNNCNNGGDYGDWITHTPSQVQDAFTNGTGAPSLTAASSETVALDVIGYTFAVPEPMSLVLIATGLASLAAARRRGLRKNSQ